MLAENEGKSDSKERYSFGSAKRHIEAIDSMLLYKGVPIPKAMSKVFHCKKDFYVQTESQEVYTSKDMVNFKYVGRGVLIGCTRRIAVMYESGLYLLHKGEKLKMGFLIKEGKIEYSVQKDGDPVVFDLSQEKRCFDAGKSDQFIAEDIPCENRGLQDMHKHVSQEKHGISNSIHPAFILYKSFLVVYINQTIMFISLGSGGDSQNVFSSPIHTVRRYKSGHVEMLIVETREKAYIYYNSSIIHSYPGSSSCLNRVEISRFEDEVIRSSGNVKKAELLSRLFKGGLLEGTNPLDILNTIVQRYDSIERVKEIGGFEKYKMFQAFLECFMKSSHLNSDKFREFGLTYEKYRSQRLPLCIESFVNRKYTRAFKYDSKYVFKSRC